MKPQAWIIPIVFFWVFDGNASLAFAEGASDFTIDQMAGTWTYTGVKFPSTQCRWNENGTLTLDVRGTGTLENHEVGEGPGSAGNPCPATSAHFVARLSSFTPNGTAAISLIPAGQKGISTGLYLSVSADRKTMTLTGSGEWYGFLASASRNP